MASSESLRLQDYKDTDLLYMIRQFRSVDGIVTSDVLAQQIFPAAMNGNGQRAVHAVRCVSIRLAWMKRYGVVMKVNPPDDMKPKPRYAWWALTAMGEMFLEGRLTPEAEAALNTLAEVQLIQATDWLSQRYVASGDIASTLMRRMWQHGTYQRKK